MTLPEFRFRVAGRDVVLHDTEVLCNEAEDGSLLCAGSLGTDFVRSFRQLTINYRRMFIRGR